VTPHQTLPLPVFGPTTTPKMASPHEVKSYLDIDGVLSISYGSGVTSLDLSISFTKYEYDNTAKTNDRKSLSNVKVY